MAIDINIPIEDAVTDGSLNPVTSNAVFDALAAKANSADLGATAFSNDYNDLDNLPTIPSVTGFVPYTGATNDVDLGVHDLTATQGTFATSGNPDTLTVNHSSGSGKALTITKGGNGEGVYVNKTSGSGNAVTIIGDLEATNIKRTGGTSSQFLKANGSIDSTSYQPTLVSGTNIKTVNGTSLLGSGDITIGGGGLTVGTTAIASGTVGRVLFQGTGNVLQQNTDFSYSDNCLNLSQFAGGTTRQLYLVGSRTFGMDVAWSGANTTAIRVVNNGTGSNTGILINCFNGTSNNALFATNGNITAQNGNVHIGNHVNAARLDVRAQGALSTDIAFRVRNSADTANLFEFSGDGTFRLGGTTSTTNGFSYLTDGRLFMAKSGSNFIELNPSAANRLYSTNGWEFEAVGTGKYLTFAANGAVRMRMIDGTIQIGSFNTSDNATNTMYFLNGTAPNTNHTDIFKIYSADIVAGNAAPHFRTENGSIIKLYKQDLPTNPTNAQIATFLSNLGLANLI
jgi:hypothetical protein